MKMKKRILSTLTAMCLCVSLLPVTVLAEEDGSSETSTTTPHSHCICGAEHQDIGDHKSPSVVAFEAWDESDSLPTTAGNYYLTEDVSIESIQTIPNGTDVVLCLNGKTITVNNETVSDNSHQDSILIEGSLTITDCKDNEGKITSKDPSTAGEKVIVVSARYSNCTLNLYGGTITGIDTGKYNGGGVHNEGTFNMYGGVIKGNKAQDGGGVCNFNNRGNTDFRKDATFNMYGGTISGNTATRYGGGVYVCQNKKDGNSGTVNLYGGEIKYNTAEVSGSGIYNDNISDTNNTINANGGTVAGG